MTGSDGGVGTATGRARVRHRPTTCGRSHFQLWRSEGGSDGEVRAGAFRRLHQALVATRGQHRGREERDGTAYVPVKRNLSLLREDLNAFDEAVRLWSDEDAEGSCRATTPSTTRPGWNSRGSMHLSTSSDLANDVPPRTRARIEQYLGKDLEALRQRRAGEAAAD
jgi:hypothetical protein